MLMFSKGLISQFLIEVPRHNYDGAANMSGAYNGCQAKVKEKQPLAWGFFIVEHIQQTLLAYVFEML